MTTDANEVAKLISDECDALKAMLLEKNENYGNSALDPIRVFSKASPVEQLLVRLDDKLSRIARGNAAGEDVTQDMIGYLVLLRIAQRVAPTKRLGPNSTQDINEALAIRDARIAELESMLSLSSEKYRKNTARITELERAMP